MHIGRRGFVASLLASAVTGCSQLPNAGPTALAISNDAGKADTSRIRDLRRRREDRSNLARIAQSRTGSDFRQHPAGGATGRAPRRRTGDLGLGSLDRRPFRRERQHDRRAGFDAAGPDRRVRRQHHDPLRRRDLRRRRHAGTTRKPDQAATCRARRSILRFW